MAESFRLQRVLELTDQRLEAATAELNRLRRRLEQERTKYDQLQGFNLEYAAGLQEALKSGMEAHRLRDYREFLDKLARAISAQGGEVERCRKVWEESYQRWLDLRQRHQALDLLKQRFLQQEARQETRREQKQQDEFALKSIRERHLRGGTE